MPGFQSVRLEFESRQGHQGWSLLYIETFNLTYNGSLAQLVEHSAFNRAVVGSIPTGPTNLIGPVAQWLERHSYKVVVGGSIPPRPTISWLLSYISKAFYYKSETTSLKSLCIDQKNLE